MQVRREAAIAVQTVAAAGREELERILLCCFSESSAAHPRRELVALRGNA
jgi:hypothetical protein